MSDGTNTFAYDNAGRMTSDGVNIYAWDRANRLLSMGGSAYLYDGMGRRIQQTVSSQITQYLLDIQPGLWQVLAATQGTNTTRYIPGPTGIQEQQNPDVTWRWLLMDGLGTVRNVVDNSTTSLESQLYDPYGVPYSNTGGTQTNFGFTGEWTDANGLINLRARHYNPMLGVFPSLDPLEGASCTPMSLNRYSYVAGNPANMVDPRGTIYEKPSTWEQCRTGTANDIHSCPQPNKTCHDCCADSVAHAAPCTNAFDCPNSDYGSCLTACVAKGGHLDLPNVPLDQPGQFPGCKVSIGIHKVTLFGNPDMTGGPIYVGNHAYIIVTDQQGNQSVYRGGAQDYDHPEYQCYDYVNGPNRPLTQAPPIYSATGLCNIGKAICTEAGVPFALSEDADPLRHHGPEAIYRILVGQEACNKQKCLHDEMIRIRAKGVAYCPLGPNSDTVAATALENCGMHVHLTEDLPGWTDQSLK